MRIAFPPGPRRKGTGQIVSVLHPLSGANPCANPCGDKFTHKNMDETITDSKGRKWGVSVLSGGKDWMAEGYPIKGHGIKTRVGRPIVARGASESEAYDKLSEAIDRRNPKKKKAVTTAEEHKKKVETKKKNRKAKVKGQRSKIKGNKKGRGEKSAPSIKSKKNLDELQDAQKVYEKFQGEAGSKVTTFDEPAERRDDFAKLGALVEIIAQPEGDPIDGKEAAKMWSQANDNDPESVQNGEIWETIADGIRRGIGSPEFPQRQSLAVLRRSRHATLQHRRLAEPRPGARQVRRGRDERPLRSRLVYRRLLPGGEGARRSPVARTRPPSG